MLQFNSIFLNILKLECDVWNKPTFIHEYNTMHTWLYIGEYGILYSTTATQWLFYTPINLYKWYLFCTCLILNHFLFTLASIQNKNVFKLFQVFKWNPCRLLLHWRIYNIVTIILVFLYKSKSIVFRYVYAHPRDNN